tara:strand:- start:244 stop:531 length:288 start_codon:yes stop_codon:yes gene_type:complete
MQDLKNKIEDLKSVAEKLAIEIKITNLSDQEFHIKSGYCKLNEKNLIFIDKSLSLKEQTEVILHALKNFDINNIYVAPWIRELIEIESNKNDPSQ